MKPKSCCGTKPELNPKDPCTPPQQPCCSGTQKKEGRLGRFEHMITNCMAYVEKAKKEGRPVIGIMCEFAPRELILAAGAVLVCLCGGAASTIPAAEQILPSNLCPLIKSTFGYHLEKSNPLLEACDLVVAETTCDGKKKMFELMSDTRTTYVLELPQKPDAPDAHLHWTAELRRFRAFLEDRFSVVITDDALRAAVKQMNRERRLRRNLADLMQADAPPLTGRELLDIKSTISCIPEDLEEYEQLFHLLQKEPGPEERSSCVRVLLTGVPTVHGAERVIDIIEEHGGLIVAQENCTGLKPIWDDVDEQSDTVLNAIAQKYLGLACSVMTPNTRRLSLIEALAKRFNAQCIVDLVWQACLTYDIESRRIKELADKQLDIPYLRIETDYSPSDSARIAVRLEALFETVQTKLRVPS